METVSSNSLNEKGLKDLKDTNMKIFNKNIQKINDFEEIIEQKKVDKMCETEDTENINYNYLIGGTVGKSSDDDFEKREQNGTIEVKNANINGETETLFIAKVNSIYKKAIKLDAPDTVFEIEFIKDEKHIKSTLYKYCF